MSKVKRSLVLILSFTLLLGTILTACGQNAGKDTASTTSAAETQAAAAKEVSNEPALPEVKLSWYILSNSQPDDELVYGEANKYIKQKLNATVDFYPLNMGEYNDKIKVKLAGGEPVDIVFTSSWLNPYTDNVAKGALMPIDELLDKYGAELKASIPEMYWEYCKIKKDGDDKAKLYGIPNYQIFANLRGLAFRKDLAEKYNLTEAINNIKTYEDLTPIFKTIKENEPEIIPVMGGNLWDYYELSPDTQPPYESTANYYVTIDTSKLEIVNDDPSFKENEKNVFRVRRDWYLQGYIYKDILTTNDEEPLKKQGKIFCYALGACKPGVEVEEKGKYGFDIIAKAITPPRVGADKVTATMNAIPNSSSNAERAMMFLNLVNTDKYLYNLLNFGMEKTHYTKIDDNTIEVLNDSKFNPGMAWAVGNQFNAFVQKGQPADVWEQTKELNKNAVRSPLEGFVFNSEPVKTELAQMATVSAKYVKILLNGAADPEKTKEKMDKELNANNNLKKVIDEVQKQLDAWKASKGK